MLIGDGKRIVALVHIQCSPIKTVILEEEERVKGSGPLFLLWEDRTARANGLKVKKKALLFDEDGHDRSNMDENTNCGPTRVVACGAKG